MSFFVPGFGKDLVDGEHKLAACSDFGLARRSVLTRNSLKSFLVQFADKGSCWRALSLALCLSLSLALSLSGLCSLSLRIKRDGKQPWTAVEAKWRRSSPNDAIFERKNKSRNKEKRQMRRWKWENRSIKRKSRNESYLRHVEGFIPFFLTLICTDKTESFKTFHVYITYIASQILIKLKKYAKVTLMVMISWLTSKINNSFYTEALISADCFYGSYRL